MKFNINSKTPKTVLVECEGLGLINEHVSPDDNLTYDSHYELESDDEYESSEEQDSDNERVRSEEIDDEHERIQKTI